MFFFVIFIFIYPIFIFNHVIDVVVLLEVEPRHHYGVLSLFEVKSLLLFVSKMSHLLVLLHRLVVHLADLELLVLCYLLLSNLLHGLWVGEQLLLLALLQVGYDLLLNLLFVFS